MAVCPKDPTHKFEPVLNVNRFMGSIYRGGDEIVCPKCGFRDNAGKFFRYLARIEPSPYVKGRGVRMDQFGAPTNNPFIQQGPTAFASQRKGKFIRRSILALLQEE